MQLILSFQLGTQAILHLGSSIINESEDLMPELLKSGNLYGECLLR